MCRLCPECKGSGEIIGDRDKCTNCRASKVVQEKKVLEVHIEKGMQHGHKIALQGQHKAINDDDIPHHGLPFMKDHHFVEFNVEFPDIVHCPKAGQNSRKVQSSSTVCISAVHKVNSVSVTVTCTVCNCNK
ncbi:hypothetical protein GUJ93_ZPchr0014g47397 [Zizania palustris]|uniref:Chaperone DnaJ C-terminal domain-containing protein n=1 Tax=Zizania palustris TaxID=103762 RepID=A0A8J5T8U2_ZIZPA|nr:hypothetical protein GUJ93_ZPchr0014g47587 [Zizania palustris]KAG8083157.1 hypothetical protein GUJ93_ZPchr0014g47397 [Zizania palustris]